jgi:hypothetical protein
VHETLCSRAFLHALQGKWSEANADIERVKNSTGNPEILVRCDITLISVLRGQQRLGDLHALVEGMHFRYGPLQSPLAFAEVQRLEATCAAGEWNRAKVLLEKCIKKRIRIPYAAWFLQGEGLRATESLLAQSQNEKLEMADRAEQIIKAGIIMEIAGKASRGKEMWDRVIREFPGTRCHYYDSLARSLGSDNCGNVEEMPHSAFRRSELFYLTALLAEHRGRAERSRELLEMGVREDPTLRWPAYMAKQKLAGISLL